MYIMRKQTMKQGLKLTHLATSYPQEISLNGKEMQLASDKININESWTLMCESVLSRTGIQIDDGNWEVDSIVINGTDKVFH